MFAFDLLQRAVLLQQKSYQLFKWLNTSIRSGSLSFAVIHESISFHDSALEWIARNLKSLPVDTRPSAEDLPIFARLFSSYLSTSFEFAEKQRVNECGCWCPWCSTIVSIKHLRARSPNRKARQDALALKRLYLERLATDLRIDLAPAAIDRLIAEPDAAEDVSLATYGRELLRRTEFASQGEGVLVLWREIAWTDNRRLNRKFQLSAAAIYEAEERLVELLKQ